MNRTIVNKKIFDDFCTKISKVLYEYGKTNDKKAQVMKKDRNEQIIRWANYVKTSNGEWKKIHTQFINAQFEKAYEFLERLSKTKSGREKIIKMYNIKNTEGYKKLLDIH